MKNALGRTAANRSGSEVVTRYPFGKTARLSRHSSAGKLAGKKAT